MAKQKKIREAIEGLRAELLSAGITLSDDQLEVIVKLVKACL